MRGNIFWFEKSLPFQIMQIRRIATSAGEHNLEKNHKIWYISASKYEKSTETVCKHGREERTHYHAHYTVIATVCSEAPLT